MGDGAPERGEEWVRVPLSGGRNEEFVFSIAGEVWSGVKKLLSFSCFFSLLVCPFFLHRFGRGFLRFFLAIHSLAHCISPSWVLSDLYFSHYNAKLKKRKQKRRILDQVLCFYTH